SACVRGVFRRLWSTMQWGVFSAAAVSMFTISLVPYTYIEYESNSNLWPGVRRVFDLTDRYQLVNSYGLFRRMTGVGGRPEVVMEGSMDGRNWVVSTELQTHSCMYSPVYLPLSGGVNTILTIAPSGGVNTILTIRRSDH
ncbi:lipase maturation factor 2a, partial [Tachysurus ichikawai]